MTVCLKYIDNEDFVLEVRFLFKSRMLYSTNVRDGYSKLIK